MNVATSAHSGRNQKGQWIEGVSGNQKGRPPKQSQLSKSLAQQISDGMTQLVPMTDARGKQEMVGAFEADVRLQIRSLPQLKPRERIATLKSLQELQAVNVQRGRFQGPASEWTHEERQEKMADYLRQVIEQMPQPPAGAPSGGTEDDGSAE
jgi:hypothetical protein